MRPATRLLLLTSLIAGCQTPCGPLWGLGFLAPPGSSPSAVPASGSPTAPGGTAPASATPRPTATTTPRPSTPTPAPTATPDANDVSTQILGTWTYSDLKYSSQLKFEANGSVDTYVSNEPGIVALYRPARYTVDGTLVSLSITDAPGFEGGSANVSISADGLRMTTNGGKVYKRK